MCFSMEFLKQILIWCIVIGAVFAILQIIIPMVMAQVGATMGGAWAVVVQILKIMLWALVLIFLVIFAFDMIGCLLGYTGGLPRLR